MKLYSILLFIVFLNLTMGFTFTMIDNGTFLPEAQGVIKMPSASKFMDDVNELYEHTNDLFTNFNIASLINGAWDFLKAAGSLFTSMVNTPSELIAQLFLSAGIVVPQALLLIVQMGMMIICAMTLIQLVTGRWFSFVE